MTFGRRGESLTGSGANSEGVLGESPAVPLCLYLHYHIHQGCLKPWFLSSVISPTTFLPVLESDRCFPPPLPHLPLLFLIIHIPIFFFVVLLLVLLLLYFLSLQKQAGTDATIVFEPFNCKTDWPWCSSNDWILID